MRDRPLSAGRSRSSTSAAIASARLSVFRCDAHPSPQLRRRIDRTRTDQPVALVCRSRHRSALGALISTPRSKRRRRAKAGRADVPQTPWTAVANVLQTSDRRNAATPDETTPAIPSVFRLSCPCSPAFAECERNRGARLSKAAKPHDRAAFCALATGLLRESRSPHRVKSPFHRLSRTHA